MGRTSLRRSTCSVTSIPGPGNDGDPIAELSRLWLSLSAYGRATVRRHLKGVSVPRQEVDRMVLQALLVAQRISTTEEQSAGLDLKRRFAVELRRQALRLRWDRNQAVRSAGSGA